MASSLGPTLLGYFALAQVYAMIFNDLFNVQTWESLIKFGQSKGENYRLDRTIKTNVLIDIIGALVAFGVAGLAAHELGASLGWDGSLVQLALIYSFVIPFTLTTLTIGVPRLFDKFAVIAKLQFLTALIKLCAVTAISLGDGGAVAFTSAYVGTEIFLSISLITYSLLLLRRQKAVDWRRSRIYLNGEQVRFLWWTNLRTIVRIPVRQLDVLIINQVMSMSTVGIYKAYKEIVSVINRLGDPVNQSIFPAYAGLIGSDQSSEAVAVTKRIMVILAALGAVVLAIFLVISSPLIERFFGPEYLEYLSAFYILLALTCFNLLLTPINSLFIAAGFAKYSFLVVLANNILYLTSALVGGVYLGIYGIVLAFAIQMAFNKGMKLYLLRRHSTGWGTVIR